MKSLSKIAEKNRQVTSRRVLEQDVVFLVGEALRNLSLARAYNPWPQLRADFQTFQQQLQKLKININEVLTIETGRGKLSIESGDDTNDWNSDCQTLASNVFVRPMDKGIDYA